MSHYTEFTWDDLQMEEQLFADYTSKYLDLKEKIGLILHQKKRLF
jgi:type I restriction enzyme R subunit